MINLVDRLLDRITMYRLLLYYLIGLLVAAVVLSSFGVLHYSPSAIVFTAAALVVVCGISNAIFASVFETPASLESSYITALILTLIITPIAGPPGVVFLMAAGGLAIASKYLLAIRRTHLFNPAAVAVALTAVGAGQTASWWVGSAALLPFVLVGGLLVVRKIRRGAMVLSFLTTAVVAGLVFNISSGGGVATDLHQTLLNSALFFLAFVMLTEPATSPATTKRQVAYGVLAGALFPPQVHLIGVYSTPELVLLVSNIFAFVVTRRVKIAPSLTGKERVAPDTYEFVFNPHRRFKYRPGQYMEWTLPATGSDSRGNRRYFTLASSPTEPTIRLGVKFYPKGSSFKRQLLALDAHTPIVAGQLGGDFTLPKDRSRKLAFIAGGIGITPYRSMVKYLVDKDERRDVMLLYSAKNAEELIYRDGFAEAEQRLGIKTFYTLSGVSMAPGWSGGYGLITAATIREQVPDYLERLFYISGTHQMVMAMQEALKELGIHHRNIKTDFFPGYV